VVVSNCSSASTEVLEELTAGGKPTTAGERATTEQVAPSPGQKEPTTVEATTEPRGSEQVAPEAPNIENTTPEEGQVLEPGQGALEQSGATLSTQKGGLPDTVAQGKGLMVMSRPESSQRQEGTEAGKQREELRNAEAVESKDDNILKEI
jgi:hypothetical protein